MWRGVTLRRLLVVWGALCGIGWLVLGGLVETEEAQCRADHGLLCSPSGLSLLIVAVAAVVVWVIGAFVIWLGFSMMRRPLP